MTLSGCPAVPVPVPKLDRASATEPIRLSHGATTHTTRTTERMKPRTAVKLRDASGCHCCTILKGLILVRRRAVAVRRGVWVVFALIVLAVTISAGGLLVVELMVGREPPVPA